MAKRFTDTDKWKKPWFRGLPNCAKIAWFYILDCCDHTGVWDADFDLMSFQLGQPISPADFENWFGTKLQRVSPDKYFIPSFIEFQYGKLNPDNKAHKKVIENLKKIGPSKPLDSPFVGLLIGAKEEEEEEEEAKAKVKEEEEEEEKAKAKEEEYKKFRARMNSLKTRAV